VNREPIVGNPTDVVDLNSFKDYVKSASGLLVPPQTQEEAPVNPNRATRRDMMRQFKRYTRQQNRQKLRKEKNA
jgi:hypothetical protein